MNKTKKYIKIQKATTALFALLLFFFNPAFAEEKKPTAPAQTDLESLARRVKEIEEDRLSRFGWNLGLFGNLNYSTKSREQTYNSFSLGDLTFYSTATSGERLVFLFEMDLEAGEDKVEIERGWVGYNFSDLLVVRAGRQHTALGYWNKTYHHGKQLYPTLDRPFFMAFEHDNGVLPVHFVGLEAEGTKKFDFGKVKYELQLGNGPSLADKAGFSPGVLDPNTTADDNDSKQPVIRISVRPSVVEGLSVGLFATTFEVDTTTKTALYESVYGMDVAYARGGLEFITEGFMFNNLDGDGNAFYTQLAYSRNDWTPYFRFERLEVQDTDPYFKDLAGGVNRSQTIAGIRYDIDPLTSCLKFQYRRDDGARDYDVFETQWAFHF